ncbi:hypothetical protein A2547_01350 [candidate division WWE3 bacterium RIFOXYD2_FULL_43_10]|nr:MAG: hypothetical protein A2547_01350 [candidate division WWE3 bacterium RIFOXYD2_FULL_43_10]
MKLLKRPAVFIKKHVYIIVFSIIYLALSFLLYKDFGVTYDEKVEYDAGKYLSSYLSAPTTLENTEKLVNDRSDNIKYYHQLPLFSTYSRVYPALLNILNPSFYFEWFHLQNLILGLFLFIFSYSVLYLVYRDGSRAVIGPILLFFTPAVTGHIPANPKDIPFAVIFLLGIFLISYFLKNPRNRSVEILTLGVVFGIAQSTRIVGFSLFITYFLLNLFRSVANREKVGETFLNSTIILMLSFFIWVLSVPFLGANFFANLIYIITETAGFQTWNHEILYMGKFLSKEERPWHYLPVLLSIQLPLTILFSLASGLLLVVRKKLRYNFSHPVFVITTIVLINFIIYFVLHPVVYNGIRHFLYLAVCLVLLAAFFLIDLYNRLKTKHKFVLWGAVSAYLFFTLVRMIHLHPYEYIYYNELTGGLRGVDKKFESDYWGAAYKESAQRVLETVKQKGVKDLKVYACDNQFAVVYYSQFQYELVGRSRDADVIICDTFKEKLREQTEDVTYQTTFPVVSEIKREGVPIHIIRAKQDFSGLFK